MPRKPAAALARLEATRYDVGVGGEQTALLGEFAKGRLNNPTQVLRLHEILCHLRANPGDKDVLSAVESLLDGFSQRVDLKRHRARLVDTGIAGTDIHYPFFWPTASWLAGRWTDLLAIDWEQIDDERPLTAALPLLVSPIHATWLRSVKPSAQKALARMAGKKMTDAVFLIRQVEAMAGDNFTREAFYDGLAPPLVLKAGAGTPSRTAAHFPSARTHFRTSPPPEGRPDLWIEMERAPRAVRTVSASAGARLIDLAREAMVTRGRDLDAFAYGDPRDVRLIDDGDGLRWAMIGLIPERRPTFRSAYGFLTLRNGVPVGYAQADTLWGGVDLAFNTFDTFRGLDTAYQFGRTVAMLRHQFGATSFTLEPYQLGEGNDEAIESGAWWFYYKLGFRPRQPSISRLANAELERIKRNSRHRSPPTVLRQLARDYLYLDRSRARAPHWPRLAALGARVDAAEAADPLTGELSYAWARVDSAGRSALTAWAPVVSLLPDLEEWSPTERSDLVEVILAKSGRRDTEYLRLFGSHPRLGPSLRRLTRA